MDSIGPTFRALRGRGTLPETAALPAPAPAASLDDKVRDLENELFRKRPSSASDPFFESAAKSARPGHVASAGRVAHGAPPFIRDHNLRTAASREHTPPGTARTAQQDAAQQDAAQENAAQEHAAQENAAQEHAAQENAAKEYAAQEHAAQEDAGLAGDDDVPLEVLEEMSRLEENFPVLAERYRLLDKIGEGTFSTVYKAEAMDGAVMLGSQLWKSPPLKQAAAARRREQKKRPLVALKQIYVTSSPNRIHNELQLLFMLSGNAHVAPLLDILRHQDQVLAILPYYQHADFRDFYRDLPVKGIKNYMWELLQGLEFMHSKAIIHRDLKPTNFLYDPFKGKGVLVDFGLAEKMPACAPSASANSCPCLLKDRPASHKTRSKRLNIKAAYPKVDQRPPRRANRAGTRGFRAPEVLFKCTNQSTKIDVWSAGIIALSLLARKFPLFNSPDDIDALVELILVFGVDKLSKCAELHGCGLELNAPNAQMASFNGNLVRLLVSVLTHEDENGCLPPDSVIYDTLKFLDKESHTLAKPVLADAEGAPAAMRAEHRRLMDEYSDLKHLLQLLYGCLSMDASKRLSASQLLQMPFFEELTAHGDDDVLL